MTKVSKQMSAILIAIIVAAALLLAAGVMTTQASYAADKQLDQITYYGKKADGDWMAHFYALDGKDGTIELAEMGIGVKDKNGKVVPEDAYNVTMYYTWWDDDANKDKTKKMEEPYGLNPKYSEGGDEGWNQCVLEVKAVSGKGYKGTLKQNVFLYDKYALSYICSDIKFKGANNGGWRMINFAIVPKSKVAKPVVTSADGTALKEGRDYTVKYYTRVNDAKNDRGNITKGGKSLASLPKTTGRYYMKVRGIKPYYGGNDFIFDISSSAHPTYMKAATSKSKPYTLTYKKVKKAKQTIAIEKLIKLQDNIVLMKKKDPFFGYPFTKVSGDKALSLNRSTGKITVKKGTKKGTYKIKVKVIPASIYSEQNVWGEKAYVCYIKVK